jgi:hypothetical protein
MRKTARERWVGPQLKICASGLFGTELPIRLSVPNYLHQVGTSDVLIYSYQRLLEPVGTTYHYAPFWSVRVALDSGWSLGILGF